MGIVERAKKAVERMRRTKRIYDLLDAEHDITADRYLWRHRLYSQQLLTDAMVALLDETKSGPTIAVWREASLKHQIVTRQIISAMYNARGPVKIVEIIEEMDGTASESTIKSCFSHGVDLRLIKKVRGGFIPTELCIDELQDRLTEKLLDPAVQAFCRFAVMWVDQRQIALDAVAFKNDIDFTGKPQMTMMEQIFAGVPFDKL